jgi:predicted Zn-dependent peptidase
MNKTAATTTALFLCLLLAAATAAPAATRLPSPEKIVLGNGLTIFYLRNTATPMVSLRLFIRGAGTAAEPAEAEGLAGLTAALATKGTPEMDAEAVAEALDFMGADLSIGVAEEYAGVSADSLAEHFPRLLEIAAACLSRPVFKEEEFAKERARRIDAVKSFKDSPGQAVRFYFQKAYFAGHPFGRVQTGTESSLANIKVEAVREFFKTRYLPENALAAVVGDIEKARLVELVERTLGQWKGRAGRSAAPVIPPLPRASGRKLLLVDKPDATQAYFVLGAPGYAMGDRAAAPAAVMNTLWGGRFTSWLNTELRIKRGLTYGASSSFRSWAAGGIFTASSYTKNDKIGEMLDITFDLLKKGAAQGFSAEETESGRNYILGQFPPTLETNASKAGAYVRLAFYNLGFDYYDRYLEEVGSMKPEALKRTAAAFLPRSDFVLVVVGKAAEIRPLLKKYGAWQEKKITDPGF